MKVEIYSSDRKVNFIKDGLLVRSNIGGGMGGGHVSYFGVQVNEDEHFILLQKRDGSNITIGKNNIVDMRHFSLYSVKSYPSSEIVDLFYAFPKGTEVEIKANTDNSRISQYKITEENC